MVTQAREGPADPSGMCPREGLEYKGLYGCGPGFWSCWPLVPMGRRDSVWALESHGPALGPGPPLELHSLVLGS